MARAILVSILIRDWIFLKLILFTGCKSTGITFNASKQIICGRMFKCDIVQLQSKVTRSLLVTTLNCCYNTRFNIHHHLIFISLRPTEKICDKLQLTLYMCLTTCGRITIHTSLQGLVAAELITAKAKYLFYDSHNFIWSSLTFTIHFTSDICVFEAIALFGTHSFIGGIFAIKLSEVK